MTTRRLLIGLAGMFAAAPKTAGNAVLQQAASAFGDIARDSLYGGGECGHAPPTPTGMFEMMNAAEKALMAAHEARVREAESDCRRRSYHRQFLHSMSPAARRAFASIDQDKVREVEGPLYVLMEKMREAYEPGWKTERNYPATTAGCVGYLR